MFNEIDLKFFIYIQTILYYIILFYQYLIVLKQSLLLECFVVKETSYRIFFWEILAYTLVSWLENHTKAHNKRSVNNLYWEY